MKPLELPEKSFRHLLENAQRGIVVLDENDRVQYCNPALIKILRGCPKRSGLTLFELFDLPDDGKPWDANREFEASDENGYVRFMRVRSLGLTDSTDSAYRWLAVVDVTEEEKALRRNLALSQVASMTTFAANMAETLDQVAANVVTALQMQGCSVMLFEGERIVMAGTSGLHSHYVATMQEIYEEQVVPIATFESFRSGFPQIARDTRLKVLPYVTSPIAQEYLRNATWNVIYSVPLKIRGKTLGSLTCYYEREREPEHELVAFLQAVADQVAILVENARLTEELRGKAVLEERQRIARELHDSVTQALYGIGLGATTATHHLERNDSKGLRASLDYIANLAHAGLSEMRALIFELRPDSLDEDGLVGVVKRLIESLKMRHGLTIEALLVEPPVSVDAKHALYRVIQEALLNVAKHAAAKKVCLRLEVEPKRVKLRIADDGRGFDTGMKFPGHFGLETMAERLQGLGGTLTVESSVAKGTTVSADLPLA